MVLVSYASDSVTNYTYDVENRLISVVGAHNGLLHYDPMGRLYKINAHDTGKTTYFLYSGDSLIAEYQSGQMTQRYVHGGGGLAPRVSYDGSSTAAAYLRFLHTNHQGSVIAQSNNSGAVTNINTYDEYGVSGAGNAGRFSYTGQMHLPEIGLYHYRARMYNPFVGRFLQTDPVGYEDQMNLYAYVHNDPLNYTDPTGEFACGGICVFGIGLAAGYVFDKAIEAIRGEEHSPAVTASNSAVGASVASTLPTQEKPRTGVDGGGPSKNKTSVASKKNHELHRNKKISLGTRHAATKVLRKVPYVGTAIAAGQLVDAVSDRLNSESGAASEGANFGGENSSSGGDSTSNSDNGMSSATVKICSGMGAQKGGC